MGKVSPGGNTVAGWAHHRIREGVRPVEIMFPRIPEYLPNHCILFALFLTPDDGPVEEDDGGVFAKVGGMKEGGNCC